MYIHQISVFIENKPGNIANFTNFLAEHKIDMRAFQIADSSDFGIIRIIVDDPFNTLTLLRDNDWICNLTHVIGVKLPDEPGSMAKAMNALITFTPFLQEAQMMPLWYSVSRTRIQTKLPHCW